MSMDTAPPPDVPIDLWGIFHLQDCDKHIIVGRCGTDPTRTPPLIQIDLLNRVATTTDGARVELGKPDYWEASKIFQSFRRFDIDHLPTA